MSRIQPLGRPEMDRNRVNRLKERRRTLGLRPLIEGLEERCVPATITWNTTVAPNGGDWFLASNWQNGVLPGPNDTAVIDLKTAGTVVRNDPTKNDTIQSITTGSLTTLQINAGTLGLTLGTSTFGGPLSFFPNTTSKLTVGNGIAVNLNNTTTVGVGASLDFGKGNSVRIAANQTFSVTGSVSFDTNSSLSYGYSFNAVTQLIVGTGGLLTTNGTSIRVDNGTSNNTTRVVVSEGGRMKATNTSFGTAASQLTEVSIDANSAIQPGDLAGNTFDSTLTLPYTAVTLLSAAPTGTGSDNQRFRDVQILSDTIPSGKTLALNSIGVGGALRYVLTGNLTVAQGASLTVAPNVPVRLNPGVNLTVAGTASLATGSSVTYGYSFNTTSQVIVASGGVLTTTGMAFLADNVNNTTRVVVSASGRLIATSTSFGTSTLPLSEVVFNANANIQPGDLANNTFDSTLTLPYTAVTLLSAAPTGTGSDNQRFRDVQILSDTIPSGKSLALNSIGVGGALRYVLTGNLTVAQGASLTVAPNVPVRLNPGVNLTVAGTASLATGSSVTYGYSFNTTSQVIVASGGVLTTTGMAFLADNVNNTTRVVVSASGRLIATSTSFGTSTLPLSEVVFNANANIQPGDLANNIFDSTLTLPYTAVTLLSAAPTGTGSDNQRFRDVQILSDTIPSGKSLALNSIGVGGALRYVLTGNLTVAQGASLTVAPNVAVVINPGVSLTVSGTTSFAIGSSLTYAYSFNTTSLVNVNNGGVLTLSGTTFLYENVNNTTRIIVNSGGTIDATYSRFSITNLTFNSGATAKLRSNLVTGGINVHSSVVVDITQNDFSGIGANGLVATGDPQATINFEKNYWGTSVNAQIDAKILDNLDSPTTRPLIDYSPIIKGKAGIVAETKTTSFSSLSQVVTLRATVSDGIGNPINEGSVTFNVLNGSTLVGASATSQSIANGIATVSYTIPAGYPVGSFVIQAIYNGDATTDSYLSVTDTSHYLTINKAVTATATVDASTTFNPSAGQTINLVATVTSASGAAGEGTLTFTIKFFGTPLGSPVTVPVVLDGNGIGTANAAYLLPIAAAGGTYTIEAVYNGTSNLAGSSNTTKRLTITKAGTTTTAQATNTEYAVAGQQIALAATVESPVGTVNEGSVVFVLRDSGGVIVNSSRTGTVVEGLASTTYVLPPGLAVGTYTIETNYNGTGNYAASSGATQTLTITAGGTTVAAVSTTAIYSALNDQDLTFTANVTSNSGTVNGGTITFTLMSGLTVIGTPVTSATVAGGTASVTYSLPKLTGAGTYVIKAKYNGTGTFLSSNNDVTHSLVVTAASTTIAADPVTATVTYSTADQNFNVSAVVSSTRGAVNAGTVTFRLLKDSISFGSATANVDSSGKAARAYTLVGGAPAGTYILEASYNGSGNFSGSTQATRTVIVVPAATTTTADVASTVFSGVADQFVTLGATIANPSGGIVNAGLATFTILEGTTVVGEAVNGDVVAGRSTVSYRIPLRQHGGTYTLKVDYGGSPNFLPFTGTGSTFTITAAPAAAATGVASSVYDAAAAVVVPVSSTVTSPRGTVGEGTVTFTLRNGSGTVIGNPITSSTVAAGTASANLSIPAGTPGGTYTLFARYNGTANFAAQDALGQPFTIFAAAPALATSTPADPATFSAVAGVTVPVSTTITSTSGPVSEGQVTFRVVRNAQVIGTPVVVNVDSKGLAATNYTLPAGSGIGSYTVEAVYGGTSNYSAFTDSSKTIHISSTTTTVSSGGSTSYNGANTQSLVFTATVTAESGDTVNIGHVEFTVVDAADQPIGSMVSGLVVNNKASATYTLPQGVAAGSYRLRTKYFDPPDFFDSVDETKFLQITPAATTSTLPSGTLTVSYSTSSQPVPITLNVGSAGGTVGQGKATFQILSGSTLIAEVKDVTVVNGAATASPVLPVGLAAGNYTVHAFYGNAANFGASTAVDRALVIEKAATTATASAASTTYNPSGATVSLAAAIDSKAGTVGAGTVTFRVIDGGNKTVATSPALNVVGGVVSTSLLLPGSLSAGTYTVQADYSGTANLVVSVATNQLRIERASPVVTWANPADIVYGTPLSSSQLNAKVSVPGTTTYSQAANTILHAGSGQKIDLDFTPTDTTNYATVRASVLLNVTKAQPAYSTLTPSQTITYGRPTVTLSGLLAAPTAIPSASPENVVTIDIGGFVQGSGTVNPDGSFSAVLAVDTLPASVIPYKVTYSYGGSSDFFAKSDNATTITVDQVSSFITITSTTGTIPTTVAIPRTLVVKPVVEPDIPTVPGPTTNLTISPNPGGGYLLKFDQNTGPATVQFLANSTNPNIRSATPVTLTFMVEKGDAQLVVDAAPRIYTGSPLDPLYTTQPAGLRVNFAYTKDGKSVTNPTAAGVYDVTATVQDNLYAGTVTTTMTIARATPSLSWNAPSDIVFGTPLSSLQLSATTPVPGTMVYTPPLGQVLGVGDGQILQVVFTPNDLANYTTAVKTVPINVKKPQPGFSNLVAPATIVYGTSTLTVTGKITVSPTVLPAREQVTISLGSISTSATVGDDGSFSATLATSTLAASATAYDLTLQYAGSSSFAAATDSSRKVLVTKAPTSVSWVTPQPVVYGTPLSALQLNATASVPGTIIYSPALGQVLGGGTNTLTATFTPTDAVNFAATTRTTTIEVTRLLPGFSSLAASPGLVYRQKLTLSGKLAAGALATTGTVAVKIGDVTETATLRSDGGFDVVFNDTSTFHVGAPIPIQYTFAGSANFEAAGNATTSLTVTPAPQAILFGVNPSTVFYNTRVPLSVVSTSGITPSLSATGADVSGLEITPRISSGAVRVVASLAASRDYTAATDVVLDIPAALAGVPVVYGNLIATYDGIPHAVSASNGPSVAAFVYKIPGGAESLAPPTNAGSYYVKAVFADPNYYVTNQAVLTIQQAPVVIYPSVTSSSLTRGVDRLLALNGILGSAAGIPSGVVTISVGTLFSQQVAVLPGGQFSASFDASTLPQGTHQIAYRYSGGGNYQDAVAVGSLTVTLPPAVSANSITITAKKKNTADAIVLTFNGPLEPGSATNLGNYAVSGAKGAAFSRAEYSANGNGSTVTLTFKKRISMKKKVTLTITSGGVNDEFGRPITGELVLTVPKKGITTFSLRAASVSVLAAPPLADHGGASWFARLLRRRAH